MNQIVRRMRRAMRALSAPRSARGRAALLIVATLTAVSVPALAYVAAAGDSSLLGSWDYYPTRSTTAGHFLTRMGCVTQLDAATLDTAFRGRFGPVIGLDNPHVIELGDDRFLWLANDTFVDYTNRAATFLDATFLNNVALVEDHGCFTLLGGGNGNEPRSFEKGPTGDTREHYFWPLGGELSGSRIYVFWAEMVKTQDGPPPSGDGINRRPVRTWLATYDARTLARLSLRPAPNDGVFPQYGFAVASDGEYSYLFGNSNMLNLSLEGGFYDGPHSATKMYLARVPRGRLDDPPAYRTKTAWSADPDEAVPISSRFWTENGMQPRYLDGHWIAVTKVDGFWGTKTIVEVARHPWGPWRTVSKRTVEPLRGFDVMTNYQPIVLPYREPDGDLLIVMSQNARHWPDAVRDPEMYRLHVYAEPWPFGERRSARHHADRGSSPHARAVVPGGNRSTRT